ncbi:MAG: hypothetical protein HY331_07835 [Chloroflexi bacterium]|nr:hypothetical protein [Chloroflexota bacterium]
MGSYQLMFLILAALYVLAAVLGVLVRPPKKPAAPATAAVATDPRAP